MPVKNILMKYDIISVGGATEDITLRTMEGLLIDNKRDVLRQKLFAFEYGAKVKIDESHSSFGGGAANVAVAARLLGLKSATVVAVGNDPRGHAIIKNLKDRGVGTSLVKKMEKESSGLSFLLVGRDNEHVVFSARGSNSRLEISNSDLADLRRSKWIYLTSLSGKWELVLRKVFSLKNAKIAWNPGHIQLRCGMKKIGAYLKKTSVLVLNKDEAVELVLSSGKYRSKPAEFLNVTENLLDILKSFGPEIVVITNGQFGAHAYDGETYFYQPVHKGKPVDTTGVGDAFGSSFIAGMEIFRNDIKKAMDLGARNSASVISVEGAQKGLLKKQDIY